MSQVDDGSLDDEVIGEEYGGQEISIDVDHYYIEFFAFILPKDIAEIRGLCKVVQRKINRIVHVTVLVDIAETDLYGDFVFEFDFCVHSNVFKFFSNVHLFFINLLSMGEYFLLLSVIMNCG